MSFQYSIQNIHSIGYHLPPPPPPEPPPEEPPDEKLPPPPSEDEGLEVILLPIESMILLMLRVSNDLGSQSAPVP